EAAVEYFFIRSFARTAARLNMHDLRTTASGLRDEAMADLKQEGFKTESIRFGFEIDMHFAGQDSEIQVGFDPNAVDLSFNEMRDQFKAAYSDIYGYVAEDEVETVNIRLRAYWPIAGQGEKPPTRPTGTSLVQFSERDVIFDPDIRPILTPVYERNSVSGAIKGPAIFESADCTFTIPPGATACPDKHSNLVVTFSD
ncbi:MAG: hypothetical protein N2B03_05435, partial [Boseongicola sp.]